jgi:O-succinylbenzoic acid--CoA ligase
LRAWLLERAARTPDAPALVASGRASSYAALAARALRRAAALRALGVAPGDRVAALLGNDPAFVELAHAAAIAGAVLVPLNPRLAPAELARQLDDAEPRLLVHTPGALAALAAAARKWTGGPAPPLTDATGLEADDAGDEAPLALFDPAAIVYTSGTSGEAKGVVLTHANLLASAVGSAFHLGALPTDRWLACLPLFHVGGLAILSRSVLAGGAVVLHERFDPDAVSRALDDDAITIASLVPAMLARVLGARGERPPPPALRAVLLGGAAAPAPLLERAAKAGWPLLPTYGLSEAASLVATLPPGAPRRADGGGLRALPGSDVRIGDGGEIQVRGPTVMAGYWRRPDASAHALAGGWLRTGDLGAIDADGSLLVLGRSDDMLVSGGENVHPAEVERALLAHPDVADAGVAGVPDPVYGARVAAWVVLTPGARADAAALERFVRARLAGYKVPRAWRFVAVLPRNAGGKLVRRALADGAAA